MKVWINPIYRPRIRRFRLYHNRSVYMWGAFLTRESKSPFIASTKLNLVMERLRAWQRKRGEAGK